MKKLHIRRVYRITGAAIILLLALSPAILAFAYTFQAPLTVQESAGTAYTQLGTTTWANNTAMVSNGFMAANGLDAKVTNAGGGTLPSMIASDRIMSANAYTASAGTNEFFSVGNTPAASMPIIPGQDGSIGIPDNDTLEPGSAFAYDWQGAYLNTANSGYLLNRKNSITVDWGVTTPSKITTKLLSTTPTNPQQYTGGYAGLSSTYVYGANETSVAFVANSSYPITGAQFYLGIYDFNSVGTPPGGNLYAYLLGSTGVPGGNPTGAVLAQSAAIPDSVVFNTPGWTDFPFTTEYTFNSGTAYSLVLVDLGAGPTANLCVIAYDKNSGTTTVSQTTNSGASWTPLASHQGLYTTDSYNVNIDHSVATAALTTGVYEVKAYETGGNIKIDTTPLAGATTTVSATGGTVTDTGGAYTMDSGNAASYMSSFSISIGGIEKLKYQPTTIIQSTSSATTPMTAFQNYVSPTYTDQTAESNSGTANDMTLLPASPGVNNAVYFGSNQQFPTITINVGTAGNYVGAWLWEYSAAGSTWSAVTTLTDNTATSPGQIGGPNSFTIAGSNTITFTPPPDWVTTTVNSIPSYYIRARLASFTSKTTSPLGTQSWVTASPTAVLVDLDGTQNGTLTWGTNPVGIYTSLGSMIPSNQPAPASTTAATTSLLPPTGTSNWFTTGNTARLAANPLAPFVTILHDLSTAGGAAGFTVYQIWVIIAAIFIIGVEILTLIVFHQHPTMMGYVGFACFGLWNYGVIGVLPTFTLVLFVPIVLVCLVLDRVIQF